MRYVFLERISMDWWELEKLKNATVKQQDQLIKQRLSHFWQTTERQCGVQSLTLSQVYQLLHALELTKINCNTAWMQSLSQLIAEEFYPKINVKEVPALINVLSQMTKMHIFSFENFTALLKQNHLVNYIALGLIHFEKANVILPIQEIITLYSSLSIEKIKKVDMALCWLASEGLLTIDTFALIKKHIDQATEIANGLTILSQGHIDIPKYKKILLKHKHFAVSVAYGLTDCTRQGILDYETTQSLLRYPQHAGLLAGCFCLLNQGGLLNTFNKSVLMQRAHGSTLLWLSNVLRYLANHKLLTKENFDQLIKSADYASFMTKWLLKMSEQSIITQANFNHLIMYVVILCNEGVCDKLDLLLNRFSTLSNENHHVVKLDQVVFDKIICLCSSDDSTYKKIEKVKNYLQGLAELKSPQNKKLIFFQLPKRLENTSSACVGIPQVP